MDRRPDDWAALAAVFACGVLAVAAVAGPGRRVRFAVWACAFAGFVNAVAGTVVTPPLQAPDEHKNVADAENLGATGRPPTTAASWPAIHDVIAGLVVSEYRVVFDARSVPRDGGGGRLRRSGRSLSSWAARAGLEGATYYPPLYYAAARIDHSGNVFNCTEHPSDKDPRMENPSR